MQSTREEVRVKKREKKKRRRKVWGNTIPFFSFAWKMRLDFKVGIDKKKAELTQPNGIRAEELFYILRWGLYLVII